MKQTELSKYHQMNQTELIAEVAKQEIALAQSRLEQRTGKLKNLHRPSLLRHDIARLKTMLRLRQLTKTNPAQRPTAPKAKPQSKAIISKKKSTKKDPV